MKLQSGPDPSTEIDLREACRTSLEGVPFVLLFQRLRNDVLSATAAGQEVAGWVGPVEAAMVARVEFEWAWPGRGDAFGVVCA